MASYKMELGINVKKNCQKKKERNYVCISHQHFFCLMLMRTNHNTLALGSGLHLQSSLINLTMEIMYPRNDKDLTTATQFF